MKTVELDSTYTPDSFTFNKNYLAHIKGGGFAVLPDIVSENQRDYDEEFFPVWVKNNGKPALAVGLLEGEEYGLWGTGVGDPVVSIHGYLPLPGDESESDLVVEESERIIDDGNTFTVGWLYYEIRVEDGDDPDQSWEATIQSWFKKSEEHDIDPIITNDHGAETHRIDDIPASVAAMSSEKREEWKWLVSAYLEYNFNTPSSLPEEAK